MGLLDRLTERVGGLFGDFIEEVMIPDAIHQRLQRAARHFDEKDYIAALEILDGVERAQPNLARVHYLKGLCHFHRGAPQEAARALRRAIELREESVHHLWAGLAMEQLQEWRSAQEHFQRALSLSPHSSFEFDLYFALGRVNLAQNRADKAIRELRKALRLTDAQPEASVVLAEALLARDQVEAARAAFDHIGRQNVQDAHAHLIDARISARQDRQQQAFDAFQAATRADGKPNELLSAHTGAARAALELGMFDAANAHLAMATGFARGEPRAELHLLQGLVHEGKGNLETARDEYDAALAQHPLHGDALLGAGRIALATDRAQDALDFFRQSMDATIHRDIEASLLGMGKARLGLGDLSGARQVLEEASKVRLDDPSRRDEPNAEVLEVLGEVALATGDYAEAVVALREAGENARAPEAVERIDNLLQQALDQLRPKWDLPPALDEPMQLERLLHAVQEYIASDPRLVEFISPVQKITRALDAPLSVAIVGEFNAGKSTLINALIGEEIVPMGVLPTTAHTGILQYGPRQAARVIWRGEQDAVEVSFAEAKRLMKDNASEIDHLEYWYPHPELRAVHFWDTPGFNALEERHEEVAARALEQAEAILWVLDANQVLSQSEFDRIEDIPAGEERLLVVINKIDRLGPYEARADAVEELVEYVEDHASAHIAGCYPVTALQAYKRQLEHGSLMPAEDQGEDAIDETGFSHFREHLNDRIIARAGRIKTIEGRRHLARLVLSLASFQHGLIKRYGDLGEEVGEAKGWLDERWRHRPSQVAEQELMELEDQVGFMLRALVREIEEALKPRGSWVSQRMVLSDEDRAFMQELLEHRFTSLLEGSRERIITDIVTLEAELAERMGPVLSKLSVQDARGLNRRLQGFQDEVRVLKVLLEERVYGQIVARARGQIEAAAGPILTEIEQSTDQNHWKALLRKLLPQIRERFQQDIIEWYDTFFTAATRFLTRAKRDLALLELEVRYRYDISPVEPLLQDPTQNEEPEEETQAKDAPSPPAIEQEDEGDGEGEDEGDAQVPEEGV